jgi:hypothetical protein
MPFNFKNSRRYLQEFAFWDLFREVVGWSKPTSRKVETLEVEGQFYFLQITTTTPFKKRTVMALNCG